jgi:hypothetical protein
MELFRLGNRRLVQQASHWASETAGAANIQTAAAASFSTRTKTRSRRGRGSGAGPTERTASARPRSGWGVAEPASVIHRTVGHLLVLWR